MVRKGPQHSRWGDYEFTFDRAAGFETQLMKSGRVRAMVEAQTADMTKSMIVAAPRGPHRFTDLYSIKKNIHGYIDSVGDEWVGYVVIEENPEARHAMLQERGYRDPAGRRHQGRFYLRSALQKERID